MKTTKIKYRNLSNGMVKVVSIENVATFPEIKKAFGEKVEKEYASNYPRYSKDLTTGDVMIITEDTAKIFNTGRYFKSEFFSFVSTMRSAGNRLQRIKTKVAEETVKEILI